MAGDGASAAPRSHLRIGRIGRPHGLAGEFKVEEATERTELLEAGSRLLVEGLGEREVDVSKGSAERPIVRLEGVDPEQMRGRALLVARERIELSDEELLMDDLIGCEIPGVGTVTGVWSGPSAEALEVDGGRVLVPLVSDAIRGIDIDARRIDVDLGFLGLES